MSWTDNMPDWMKGIFSAASDAEVVVATEGDEERLRVLRDRADKLRRRIDLFSGADELMEDIGDELGNLQTAMVLTRDVNDLLRLQGQAVALYRLVETPKEAAKELSLVMEQLKPLEQLMAARDAAAAGE